MLLTIVGLALVVFALATIWTRGYGPQGETTLDAPAGKIKTVFPSLIVLFMGVALLAAGQIKLPALRDAGEPQAHVAPAASSPHATPSPALSPTTPTTGTPPPTAGTDTAEDASATGESQLDETPAESSTMNDDAGSSTDSSLDASDASASDSTGDPATTGSTDTVDGTPSTTSPTELEPLDPSGNAVRGEPGTQAKSTDGSVNRKRDARTTTADSGPWTDVEDDVQLVVERVRPGKGVGGRLRVYFRVENDSADDITLDYDASFLVVDTAGNSYGFDDEQSTFPLAGEFWGGLDIKSHHTRAGFLLLDEKVPRGTNSLDVRVVFTKGFDGPSTRLLARVPIDAHTQRSPGT